MLTNIKRIIKKTFLVPSLIICKCRSVYYSRRVDHGGGKIIIRNPFLKISIIKSKNSKLILRGNLLIEAHLRGNSAVSIILEQNSSLEIGGDFIVGNGVKLVVHKYGTLYFGGKQKESGSGITADTIIMAHKKIHIGKDFLCAWGVFITDSDWHTINNENHQSDVIIEDHVWIANNSTVLKGSHIGFNTIVAGQSKVSKNTYPPDSLLAGIPAKVITSNITWSRDIA